MQGSKMAKIEVRCPVCKTTRVVKFGNSETGKQRFRCNNTECSKNTFILDYTNKGFLSEVKKQIIEMALNGSGVRDTARVLKVSVNTVISELKKSQ
ncbi:MAG: transposase [Gammaproteobacteria bacterium]|jgi:transposase-like protein|nr:transposase [Gammaproteobacteria bacterium]